MMKGDMMMLKHGYHHTDNTSLHEPVLPAALALSDGGGVLVAKRSEWKMIRLADKGNPSLQDTIERAAWWRGQGWRVKLYNEWNNPHEGYTGTPADAWEFQRQVGEAIGWDMLYCMSPSPGFPNWLDWLPPSDFEGGVCVNVYGYAHEIQAIIEAILARLKKARIVVSEWNPAWSRQGVDLNAYGRHDVPTVLDYLNTLSQLEAALYFADNWAGPDSAAPHMNAIGTEIHTSIHKWQPKVVAPLPIPPKEVPGEMDTITRKFWEKMNQLLPGKCYDYRSHVHNKSGNLQFVAANSVTMPFATVHHSESQRKTTVADIDKYHILTAGFAGFGYHALVRLGAFYLCSSLNMMRAHVAGRNDEALGFCVTGDYTDAQPALEDVLVLRAIVASLDYAYGHQKQLVGHRELLGPGYLCPANLLPVWKAIRMAPPETIAASFAVPDAFTAEKVHFVMGKAARDARDVLRLPTVHDYIVSEFYPVTDQLRKASLT